ncbi:hypothetical protein MOVS_10735 (plasmid) [Moraxella ovis]|uniref:Multifunctional conjugation protein TraI n=1 Tax=Moraxella ovis TaxID=29433 RepID=A0A378QGZ7_9GAMM|nr:MobF family relaxase [Moraxella ovis]ANB92563.1 hypothetical protein MOVS_10735 [Moraxella ovis]STY98593.1 Multifunctional conjugation protein TraI [Moraxella ovis]
MLNVSNVGSTRQALSYYAKDDFNTVENTLNNTSWQGAGAQKLGLSGAINPQQFEDLLNGKVEGQQLGRIEKDENGEQKLVHRAAVDITFSAPKSISILSEVFGDERLRAAHEEAVSETLEAISQEAIKARVTQDGVTKEEYSSDVIIAKFSHDTNRLQEPDTHTHALIMNAVKGSDGKWRSIDNSGIYAGQRMYGAMYTNLLAEKVQKLGYEIEIKDSKGNFDIKGISQEAIDAFSTRKQEIDAALSELGLSRDEASAAQREIATLNTRNPKINVAHELLKDQWQEKAQTLGVEGSKLIQDSKQRYVSHANDYKQTKNAIRTSLNSLSEREAVFSNRDLRQLAYERSVGISSVQYTDYQIKQMKQSGRIVEIDGVDKITTKSVINSESWTIKTITDHKGSIEQVVTEDRVNASIAAYEKEKGFRLTDGQRQSVEKIFNTKDRFIGVQGLAGTGKTTMLEVVKNIAQDNGLVIRGMSGTKKAANNLMQETGIQSETNTMFLINARQAQKEFDAQKQDNPEIERDKEIWVVDESSFAGQRELNSIANYAIQADARVIFLGDKMQLQSISFGKPFEIGQERGMDYSEMKDINRQKTAELKTIVDVALGDKKDQLLAKNIQKAVDIMQSKNMVKESKNSLEELVEKVVSLPKSERDKSMVITPFNANRQEYNQLYRDKLQDRGELGGEEVVVASYKRVNMTEAQRGQAFFYQKDNLVKFGSAVRYLGIEKNDVLKVVGFDDKRTIVKLEDKNGKIIDWKPAKSHRPNVYQAEKIKLAVGDRIKFTENDSDKERQRYANNTEAVVTKVKDGEVTVKTQDGKEFALTDKDRNIDYNYASTVYASQGSTYNNTYLYIHMNDQTKESERKNLNKIIGDRMFYVALTRSKMNFELHTNDAAKLKEVLSAKQDKTFAIGELEKNNKFNQQKQGFDLEKTLDHIENEQQQKTREHDKDIEH